MGEFSTCEKINLLNNKIYLPIVVADVPEIQPSDISDHSKKHTIERGQEVLPSNAINS